MTYKEHEIKIITCSRCGRESLPQETYYAIRYIHDIEKYVCYDCMKEINGEDDGEDDEE